MNLWTLVHPLDRLKLIVHQVAHATDRQDLSVVFHLIAIGAYSKFITVDICDTSCCWVAAFERPYHWQGVGVDDVFVCRTNHVLVGTASRQRISACQRDDPRSLLVDIHPDRVHDILSLIQLVGIKCDPTFRGLKTDCVVTSLVTLRSPKPDIVFP